MRFIETDTRAGSQLRALLRTYDDCVRTGDGTRYKKSSSTTDGGVIVEMYEDDADPATGKRTLQQANQSLLRALMAGNHRPL